MKIAIKPVDGAMRVEVEPDVRDLRITELEDEIAHVKRLITMAPPGPFGDGGLSYRVTVLESELRDLIGGE